MIAKHLLSHHSIKIYPSAINIFRGSHKFNNLLPRRSLTKHDLKQSFYNFSRRASTSSSTNKTLPFILGLGAAGGAFAAYHFYTKDSPTPEDTDELNEQPFIHEHLDEDLALLSEFGPIPYLLIGAGAASFTAFKAIRTKDPTAKVLVIGEEAFLPYMRPPLSKDIWFESNPDTAETLTFTQWDGRQRSVFYEPSEFFFTVKDLLEHPNGGISVIRGKKVVKIDPDEQVVYLDKGERVSYKKCLVATGARPKNLPVFEKADSNVKKHVTFYRNIQDYRNLDKICKKVKSIVIVGGGFLGSELACGLAKKGGPSGLEVVQLFPETGNVGKVLPEYLSKWTSKILEKDGVKVIPEVTVESVSSTEDGKVNLVLKNGKVLKTDHIVVAVGVDPNTDFAKESGLEVDEKHGGFLVNPEMEARKNLWVAGDASCFYDIKLGRRRVEHHDHAVVSGRLAGENMAGEHKPYRHQSMFWSDLGPDIGFEGIGLVDSSLPTVGVFVKDNPAAKADSDAEKSSEGASKAETDPALRAPEVGDDFAKGILFYLKDDIIVGMVLWNVLAKMNIARQIINESKTSQEITELAKLFELYEAQE